MQNIDFEKKQLIQQQQDIHFGDGNYLYFEDIVGFQIQSMHYVYERNHFIQFFILFLFSLLFHLLVQLVFELYFLQNHFNLIMN